MSEVGKIVLPGDVISNVQSFKGVTLIGPGLRRHEDSKSLIASRSGVLMHKSKNVYWVECKQKRYIPKKGDLVVGVVAKKSGDIFKVDIGSFEYASLSTFAFEGATKKQKPDLQVGDILYAKLISAHKEMEPELVCVDKFYKAYNLGPLSNDGFVITLAPDLIQNLLDPNFPLLATLGKNYKYEIAIGMNGKVWIRSATVKDTLNLVNAFYAAQFQTDTNVKQLCQQY